MMKFTCLAALLLASTSVYAYNEPLGGTAPITNGGTGATSAAGALMNLGAAQGIDPRAAPYNAKCDGVTDDTAAWNAAAIAAYAASVPVIMPPALCYVGASGNVHLSSIAGTARQGYSASPATEPGTLLLSPAYTLANQYGATPWPGVTVSGIRILRAGFTQPVDIRSSITSVNAYSGTAVTLSANDALLRDVTIQGFSTGVIKSGARNDLVRVRIDAVNGVSSTACVDSCFSSDIEVYPFAESALSAPNQLTTITGITSGSGGVCQIGLTTAPAVPIVTGDIVVVNASGTGTTGCSGRFTVANAIDSADFTLNGSTFGGTYTSGGSVFLTADRRTGVAWASTGTSASADWINGLVEFGYDVSVHFGGGTTGNRINGLWTDGPTGSGGYSDMIPTGVLVDGTSNNNIITNGYAGAKTNTIKVSSTGAAALTMSDMKIGVLGGGYAGITGSGLAVTGATTVKMNNIELVTNSVFGTDTLPWANITNGNTVYLSGLNFETGVDTAYSFGATACGVTFIDGMAGPCVFQPYLYGSTSGTGHQPNYMTQDGQYTVTVSGVVNVWEGITTSQTFAAAGSMSGYLFTSLPVATSATAAKDASCVVSRIAGWTATTNYNALTATITPSTAVIQMSETSAINGNNTISAPLTDFPGVTGFAITCTYHE